MLFDQFFRNCLHGMI